MTVCSYSLIKKCTCCKENYLSLKLFWICFFKIDSITLDPDPDSNWAKILDPDPNSMYLDPQHWFGSTLYHRFYLFSGFILIIWFISYCRLRPNGLSLRGMLNNINRSIKPLAGTRNRRRRRSRGASVSFPKQRELHQLGKKYFIYCTWPL